ncbi:MAG: glycosyltransferase [Lachnospiraceae bacterium]
MHGYLAKASALVLPSYHEGMSNVLMEASATGRPVITTTVSGCKEVFEEGVTGFGCRKEDSEDLIRALEKFLAFRWENVQKWDEKPEKRWNVNLTEKRWQMPTFRK